MKVLMLNGSSHINGTTFTALNEIGKALNNEGIDYEIFQIGADAVRDCIGWLSPSGWAGRWWRSIRWCSPCCMRSPRISRSGSRR